MKLSVILIIFGSFALTRTLETELVYSLKSSNITSPPKDNPLQIQVRISVQDKICGSLSPPYNASYFLSNVVKGNTLFDTMQKAAVELGLSYAYSVDSNNNPHIRVINGLYANDTLRQYWSILDAWTGQLLPAGVGSYKPKDGDNLLFKLDLF